MATDLPTIQDKMDNTNVFESSWGDFSTEGARANSGIDMTERAYGWQTDDNEGGAWFNYVGSLVSQDLTDHLLCVSTMYHEFARMQVDTVATPGWALRMSSGSSPTSNYKEWYLGGKDTERGKAQNHMAVVIDPDATAQDTVGTFDKTDSRQWAGVHGYFNQSGGGGTGRPRWSRILFINHADPTDTNMPKVFGISASLIELAEDTLGTAYDTIFHRNAQILGGTIFLAMPFTIGKSGSTTVFTDDGYTFLSPGSNEWQDPRFHITTNSMRVYLRLENGSATAEFSGTYVWGTEAPWDFNNDTGVCTFKNPSFKGMGQFTIGSEVTGPATFNDVGVVVFSGCDLDGSTFINPNNTHCCEIPANATLEDMTFSTETAADHAIKITAAGTYTFNDLTYSGFTHDLDVTASSGTVTINVAGGDTPTYTSAGATVVINNNVNITITCKDSDGAAIENVRVAVYKTSDDSELMNELTTALGVATESFNYVSSTAIYWRARKSSTGTRYFPAKGTGTITSSGFSAEVTMIEDGIVA